MAASLTIRVRPCELRAGDRLWVVGEWRRVVAGPFPQMVPGRTRARLVVFTDRGDVSWALADASRFELAEIAAREVVA